MLSAFSTLSIFTSLATFTSPWLDRTVVASTSFFLAAGVLVVSSAAQIEPKLLSWRRDLQAYGARQTALCNMFAGTLAIGVACHFYRLANFLLSIDDEMAAIRVDPRVWIGQGRWTIYWVERLFFSPPALPFLPDATFCLAMTLSYLLILKSHRVRPGILPQLLFPLFCAYPVLTVLGEFYANIPSLGVGFLLSAFAVALADELRGRTQSLATLAGWGLHTICVAASIGCYQSFVLVYAVFGLGALLTQSTAEGCPSLSASVRRFSGVMLQTCTGLLLYQAIQKIHLRCYPSDQRYIESLTDIGQLWRTPRPVLEIFFGRMYEIYAGSASLYGASLGALKWVFALGLVAMLMPFGHRAHWRPVLCSSTLAVAIVILPHAFALLSGGHMPLRTYVAAPYVVWLFAYFATQQRHLAVSLLGSTLALLAVFQVFHLNHLYAAEMTLAQQRDRSFAQEIFQQLEATKADFSLAKDYEIDVFGMMPPRHALFPSDASSTTGGSFFNWDQGNPSRMLPFMNLLGFSNIHMVNKQQRELLIPIFATMPCWPAPGSVQWRDGIALVKLSSEPGAMHAPQ